MQNSNIDSLSLDFLDQLMAMQDLDLIFKQQQQRQGMQSYQRPPQFNAGPSTTDSSGSESTDAQLGGIAQNFGGSVLKSGGSWQAPALIAAAQLFKMNSDDMAKGKGNHGWFKTMWEDGLDPMFGREGLYGLFGNIFNGKKIDLDWI